MKKMDFLYDMSCVELAVYNAFKPDKMNIESLGNSHAHLHWHIFPRRKGDLPFEGPIWYLGKKELYQEKNIPNEIKREELKRKISFELEKIIR